MQKIDPEAMQTRLIEASRQGCAPTVNVDSARLAAESLANRLWPMLTEAYGYKFASQFGEAPSSTWIGALKGISGRQVANAMNLAAELYPEWPPGALQFRAMCLGIDKRNHDDDGNDAYWQHKRAEGAEREWREAMRAQRLRLEDQTAKEAAKAAGERELAKMRATIGLDRKRADA